jgi:tetratricopeptide (TPR) repeat protein
VAEAERDDANKRIAGYSRNRGRIFELEFKPLQALPCYEKAYRLCPDDPDYALPYAGVLLAQRDYRGAEPVYVAACKRLRELMVSEPGRYRDRLTTVLNSLGTLYAEEHRFAEAREAFEEALAIRRELARAHPAAYRPHVATTLNNLGILHRQEHRFAEAREAFEEALAIRRELARAHPAAYRPDVATTLNCIAPGFLDTRVWVVRGIEGAI